MTARRRAAGRRRRSPHRSSGISAYAPAQRGQHALEEAISNGELWATDFHSLDPQVRRFFTMRRYGHVMLGKNFVHLPGVDGSTSAGKTRADVQGRQALLRAYRFLRRQPGLEGFHYTYVATETGIRESYA